MAELDKSLTPRDLIRSRMSGKFSGSLTPDGKILSADPDFYQEYREIKAELNGTPLDPPAAISRTETERLRREIVSRLRREEEQGQKKRSQTKPWEFLSNTPPR